MKLIDYICVGGLPILFIAFLILFNTHVDLKKKYQLLKDRGQTRGEAVSGKVMHATNYTADIYGSGFKTTLRIIPHNDAWLQVVILWFSPSGWDCVGHEIVWVSNDTKLIPLKKEGAIEAQISIRLAYNNNAEIGSMKARVA